MSIFKYSYVPESQLQSPKSVLLSEGESTFVIDNFYDRDKEGHLLKTAKDGVAKVNLVFNVTDIKGKKGRVIDTFTSNTGWKFYDLSRSVGILAIYNEQGFVDLEKLVGLSGKCMLKLDKREGFEPRCIISKYIASSGDNKKQNQDNFEDDDVPF